MTNAEVQEMLNLWTKRTGIEVSVQMRGFPNALPEAQCEVWVAGQTFIVREVGQFFPFVLAKALEELERRAKPCINVQRP